MIQKTLVIGFIATIYCLLSCCSIEKKISNYGRFNLHKPLQDSLVKVGRWIEPIDSNGVAILKYKKGIRNGKVKEFFENKGYYSIGHYKNNERHGMWFFFSIEDGTIYKKIWYLEGMELMVYEIRDGRLQRTKISQPSPSWYD